MKGSYEGQNGFFLETLIDSKAWLYRTFGL